MWKVSILLLLLPNMYDKIWSKVVVQDIKVIRDLEIYSRPKIYNTAYFKVLLKVGIEQHIWNANIWIEEAVFIDCIEMQIDI